MSPVGSMTLARPACSTQWTSRTASSMSWGWTIATPARRPGQLAAEVGQPAVEDPGTGLAQLRGGVREREARRPMAVRCCSGSRRRAPRRRCPRPRARRCGRRSRRRQEAPARDGLLAGVDVDHRLAEERVHELAVLGQPHRAVALDPPRLAGRRRIGRSPRAGRRRRRAGSRRSAARRDRRRR